MLRSRLRFLLRWVIGAGILAVLLLVVPLRDLFETLRQIPAPVWLTAVGVYLLLHLVGVAKWRLLINAAGAGLSFSRAARCYYHGLFGNTFLPSVVGGDVVRAGLALRLSRSPAGLVFGSLVDRALDLAALGTVAALGALLLPGSLAPETRLIPLIFLGILAGVTLLAVVLWLLIPGRRIPHRLRRRLVTFRRAAQALRTHPRAMVTAWLLGVTLQCSLVGLNAWIGRAAGVDRGFAVWLFVWPLAKVSAIVPITQGGIGVREAAIVALLRPFGVPAVAAMAAGLVLTSVVGLGGLAGGAIAYVLGRLDRAVPLAEPVAPT